MEELERAVYLILRSLFLAWTSRVPEGTAPKAWFYAWSLLVCCALSLFIIGVFFELLRHLLTHRTIPQISLYKLTFRLATVVKSLRIMPRRIGVPGGFKVPLLICIVALLFAAIGTFPYDFYVLLRIAVCFTCAIEFMMFREQRNRAWSIVFLFVALLYNPFIPMRLHRPTWVAINWITLVLFGAVWGLMKPVKTVLPPLTHK